MAYIRTQTMHIANGAAITTEAFDASGMAAIGLQLPAAFTSASITFNVSTDDVTYQQLQDVSDDAVGTSAPVKVLVTQGLSYALSDALTAWGYFKIVTAGNEGAARVLVVTAKAP